MEESGREIGREREMEWERVALYSGPRDTTKAKQRLIVTIYQHIVNMEPTGSGETRALAQGSY